jgi:type II secretory pathway pseudopilin PulG
MRLRKRAAFTLFELLVVLVLLLLLFALLLPFIAKASAEAQRAKKLNNLKELGIACHNYHDQIGFLPAGNDGKNFSAVAYLLPYIDQGNVYKSIDFTKDVDDKANAEARKTRIKVFLSPQDTVESVNDWGGTSYLFSAGSKPSLKDNDGVFYQDSKVRLVDIVDGTSNTLMIGETLKGGGEAKEPTVQRQHVLLKEGDLKDIGNEAGVKDFKDGKNIAGDRCSSWMDGRFLQGTFTATRLPNDERPDVNCAGAGGLSALRSLDNAISVCFCDGSVRIIKVEKIDMKIWQAIATRAGAEEVPDF